MRIPWIERIAFRTTATLPTRVAHCWVNRTFAKRQHWNNQAREHLEAACMSDQVRFGGYTEEEVACTELVYDFWNDLDGLPLRWFPAVRQAVTDWLSFADWDELAHEIISRAYEA